MLYFFQIWPVGTHSNWFLYPFDIFPAPPYFSVAQGIPDSSSTFPTLALESAISSKSSGFF